MFELQSVDLKLLLAIDSELFPKLLLLLKLNSFVVPLNFYERIFGFWIPLGFLLDWNRLPAGSQVSTAQNHVASDR